MKPDLRSSLDDWLDWLLSLHAQEIDLGLERISSIAEKMGLLSPSCNVITVAGTNGKGSSVAMLASVYQKSGFQVGSYTSPHLVRFNERIQINLVPVSDQQIIEAFNAIEKTRGEVKLTYFEFSTLAALYVFKQYSLDLILLEVGLGGRLDAVNIVDSDVALITAIDVDHSDWLGDNRDVIAVEKAGIMRRGKLAVCSDPCVPQTLIDYADKNQVELSLIGRDFFAYETDQDWFLLDYNKVERRHFSVPALKGGFQIQNAAGVVAVIDVMSERLPVSDSGISEGLKAAFHPGRLQLFNLNHQKWLVDVAHNPQSASVLTDYLALIHYDGNAIFSVLSDKDYKPMIKMLLPYIDKWYIADLHVSRSEKMVVILETLVDLGVEKKNILCFKTIENCVENALSSNQKDWLVWGSFFTVGQVLETQSFKESAL